MPKYLCKVCQANSTESDYGVCMMCVENKIKDGVWKIYNFIKNAREYGKNIPYIKKYDC